MITCTLGTLSIPLANASVRVNATAVSISATSPAVDLASAIATESGAELVLAAGTVEIARAAQTGTRIDIGSRSASITLSAAAATPSSTPKAVPIYGVGYRSLSGGKRRYRGALLADVRIGDTVTWGSESIVVAEITHTMTATSGQTEVAE